MNFEKDNDNDAFILSNIFKGNSYNEEINKQKEISYFHESQDFKSDDSIYNSNIIDDINSNMINFKEMNKVFNDMTLILYKSNFIFNMKEKEFKIQYGNNIIKEYKGLISQVEQYKKQIFQLFDNFSKLIKFLEKAQKEIKEKIKNEPELEINLYLYTIKDSHNNFIKNLKYSYKINKTEFKNNLLFQEYDILNKNAHPSNLDGFINDIVHKICIDKIELEFKEKREKNKNSNMFFAIISKYLDKSNKIIELSNEIRYMDKHFRKVIYIKRFDIIDYEQNLNYIKNLEKEIDKKELIKNINEIQNILEQSTIILNINENEEEENITIELNFKKNLFDINDIYFQIHEEFGYIEIDYHLYSIYSSLIEKYKDLILFIEEIKKKSKYKFPKDKFIIKLNIKNCDICEYDIFDELYDLKNKNIIYQDQNILKHKDYSGFELFLDNIIKKNDNLK